MECEKDAHFPLIYSTFAWNMWNMNEAGLEDFKIGGSNIIASAF